MSVSGLLDDGGTVSGGIGSILRGAREAAGYSVDDIAARMRLSRDNIENMEAERFDRFPVAVFLRGYLTSYARLLELDPKPLLEAYDRKGFGPPRLHSQEASQGKPRGSDLTVTVTTLIVVAVLIVLSVLWWRERWGEDGEAPSAGPVPERIGEPRPVGGGAPDEPEGFAEIPGADVAPDAPGAPASAPGDGVSPSFPEGADLAAAPASEPASGSGVDGAAAPSEEEEEPRSGADGDPGVPEAPASPAAGSTATPGADDPAPSGAPPSGAPASIVIRVREDCWIMIRDAQDRFVYRDLAAAGTTLELSGVPPIRVVAGYAKGIDVEFNGEPVDLLPHIEQETGTARFRLGA